MKLSKYLYNKVREDKVKTDERTSEILAHLYLYINSKNGYITYYPHLRQRYTIHYNGLEMFSFKFK